MRALLPIRKKNRLKAQSQLQAAFPPQQPVSRGMPRGAESILLVEDDAALRDMMATLLKRLGYTVWSVTKDVEALALRQQRDAVQVDLLITNAVMPHMSGRAFASRFEGLSPHAKILYTSEHTENAIVQQGGLNNGAALLRRHFTLTALARKVRQTLDAQ